MPIGKRGLGCHHMVQGWDYMDTSKYSLNEKLEQRHWTERGKVNVNMIWFGVFWEGVVFS